MKLPSKSMAAGALLSPDGIEFASDWIRKTLGRLSENNAQDAENYKKPLKSMLNSLVDTQDICTQEAEDNSFLFLEDVSLAEHIKRKLKSKLNEIATTQRQSGGRTGSDFTQREGYLMRNQTPKRQQRLSFSELGATAAAHAFGRQRRTLSFASLQSPGPACYAVDSSSLSGHPSAVLCTDKLVRHHFLLSAVTPGPSAYHPSKHFVSK